jgi:hypothetical protein
LPEPAGQVPVGEQPPERRGEGVQVGGIVDEQPFMFVSELVLDAADVGCRPADRSTAG